MRPRTTASAVVEVRPRRGPAPRGARISETIGPGGGFDEEPAVAAHAEAAALRRALRSSAVTRTPFDSTR